jgi:hypothetical protein
MTPAVPKVSTCTVNLEALIRNPRWAIPSGCGGRASQRRNDYTPLRCGLLPRVNVSNNSPNGAHLKINDAVELLTSHTKFAPSRAQTTLSAIES